MESAMSRRNTASPFHRGEIAMQTRAGVRESAQRVGGIVRDAISEGFADFLGEVRLAGVGAEDAQGRLWATILMGPEGFLHARGPVDARDRLIIAALPVHGDALATRLTSPGWSGAPVGMTAIDLATRRRVRVNGLLARREQADALGFALDVREAYGNCPKYITAREVLELASVPREAPGETTPVLSRELDAAQLALVRRADMLFLASIGPDQRADASHRGGRPGFVREVDATHIVIPDYSGNRMFNSLGNLLVDPRIGLVFPDFERGALLQVSGRATVEDAPEARAAFPGAERVVDVTIEYVNEVPDALSTQWHLLAYSPFDPPPAVGAS
jgi:predicted pyridoxine 5'-phosphate oxidase superfamily flavin-nucleotide-binding protein